MTDFSHRGKRAEEAKGSQLEFHLRPSQPRTLETAARCSDCEPDGGPAQPPADCLLLQIEGFSSLHAHSCGRKPLLYISHSQSQLVDTLVFQAASPKKKKKKSQGQINLRTTVNSAPQLEHFKTHINLLKTPRVPTTKRQVWLDSTHVFLNSFDHETFTFL